uniref:Proteasome subunit beta n=1 Tax=Globisporangium ultimum (strain ATCC 200006 / CBS 805.95 / DAOM BR144) TaxID=431595 RepID=K3X2V0_GLOUD
MDSIFGIVGKDFVIVAADAKVARSILVYKDDEDKTVDLDSHKVLVGSGPQSDRVGFSEYIQKNMKLYELRNGVSLNGPATANYVRGELARFLRKSPYQVNLLIGAVDEETTPEDKKQIVPSLHWIDYLGTLATVNFGAHGYGANFCLSIFDREWRPDLNVEEAHAILKKCRNELEQRFLVRNGKWLYKIIDANGVRVLEFE